MILLPWCFSLPKRSKELCFLFSVEWRLLPSQWPFSYVPSASWKISSLFYLTQAKNMIWFHHSEPSNTWQSSFICLHGFVPKLSFYLSKTNSPIRNVKACQLSSFLILMPFFEKQLQEFYFFICQSLTESWWPYSCQFHFQNLNYSLKLSPVSFRMIRNIFFPPVALRLYCGWK